MTLSNEEDILTSKSTKKQKPDDKEKRAWMLRKAESDGNKTLVTLRLSGARLHIRNRGMKLILQFVLCAIKIKTEPANQPDYGQEKGEFDRKWREPSCQGSTDQVKEVVEKEYSDRAVVTLEKHIKVFAYKITFPNSQVLHAE